MSDEKDQTKRMAQIIALSEAMKRTDEAISRAVETLHALQEKRTNQAAELRFQKLRLKRDLP